MANTYRFVFVPSRLHPKADMRTYQLNFFPRVWFFFLWWSHIPKLVLVEHIYTSIYIYTCVYTRRRIMLTKSLLLGANLSRRHLPQQKPAQGYSHADYWPILSLRNEACGGWKFYDLIFCDVFRLEKNAQGICPVFSSNGEVIAISNRSESCSFIAVLFSAYLSGCIF